MKKSEIIKKLIQLRKKSDITIKELAEIMCIGQYSGSAVVFQTTSCVVDFEAIKKDNHLINFDRYKFALLHKITSKKIKLTDNEKYLFIAKPEAEIINIKMRENGGRA